MSVANYPGTTVSVSRGNVSIRECDFEVIDTPGMYSLLPMTDDERVARNILFSSLNGIVVHVVDAKNLDRMLALTFQLKEMGVRLILDVNIVDEADRMGLAIHEDLLEKTLQMPVIKTVSIRGDGIETLKERIYAYAYIPLLIITVLTVLTSTISLSYLFFPDKTKQFFSPSDEALHGIAKTALSPFAL